MTTTHWMDEAGTFGRGVALAALALAGAPACTDDGVGDSDDTQTETSGDGDGDGDGDSAGDGDGDGDSAGDGDGDSAGDGDGDPAGDSFSELLEFLGGEQALTDMTGFRSVASGVRAVANEGQLPGDPAMQIGTFDTITSYDFTSDAARIDYERFNEFLGGVPVSYAEIYAGELGYVAGDDGVIFPGPTDAPMLSSRWASGRKQLALLNPHLLVREVLAGARAAAVSEVELEGCAGVVELEDVISPIFLCVLEGGELASLHTMVNDFLLRDVELSVSYAGWSGEQVPFPAQVSLSLDGDELHSESREVELDPELDPASLELPEAGMFDMGLAAYGEATHQFFQTFSAMGIPLDFPFTNVVATELAPGVHHLTGASHHSLVVEQDERVIVLEAPNNPERGEAVLAWIAEQIPDKPVTHVIATHHHEDHTAGLRAFAAAGVEVVMHEDAVDYFAEEVFTAPSTIVPDALADADVEPLLTGVGAQGLVLDDSTHAITRSHLPNGHAADMLLMHVAGGGGIAFFSDVYNPGNGGSAFNPAWAQSLLDALQDAPPAATLAAGHGSPAPLAELENYLALL